MVDSHHELRQRLHELEQQVARLQQQQGPARPRQLSPGAWAVALVVALAIGLFAGQAPMAASGAQERGDRGDKDPAPKALGGDEIACKVLKILGPDGKERITFGTGARGGFIKILGNDGGVRVLLDVDNDGGLVRALATNGQADSTLWIASGGSNGLVSLRNTNGKNMVFLSGDKFGGNLQLVNPDGKTQAGFYCGAGEVQGGHLNIMGSNGKVIGVLGPDKNGHGGLELRNVDGQGMAFLSIDNLGGLLDLHNMENKSTATIYAATNDSKGGLINLRGPTGKASVVIDGGKDGTGSMGLRNVKGTELLYLGTSTAGHGTIDLRGSDAGTRLLMGVDNDGVGSINGRDANGTNQRFLR